MKQQMLWGADQSFSHTLKQLRMNINVVEKSTKKKYQR